MKRDLALLVTGAWVMGTIFMALVATQNFYLIDRLLIARPSAGFDAVVDTVGSPQAREFMRYLASELNRLFFIVWGGAQVILGAILVGLVWNLESRSLRNMALATLLLAVVLMAGLTPPIVSVGRSLDFVPREPSPPGLATFGLLHAAYTITDFSKLVLILLAGFRIHRVGR